MIRFSHKRFLLLALFTIWAIVSFGLGWLQLEIGKDEVLTWDQVSAYTVPTDFLSSLGEMSGTILVGPRSDTRSRWSSMMSQNNHFLYGWLYDITDKKAKKWLREQSQSKDIKRIMENKKFQQFGNDFAKWQNDFSGTSIELQKDEKLGVNFTHAKAFVGDKRRAIQSANLTHSSLAKNVEHYVLGTDENVRQTLLQYWMKDWTKVGGSLLSSMDRLTSVPTASLSPHVLICPINCRQVIEYMIRHARQSIWIQHQYLTDSRITKLLQKKTDLDLKMQFNDFPEMAKVQSLFGRDVVHLQAKPYIHAKLIIIDHRYMIIGSMNLSSNALDRNRELGIIITDPQNIKDVESEIFRSSTGY